jgi:hypothetical protein
MILLSCVIVDFNQTFLCFKALILEFLSYQEWFNEIRYATIPARTFAQLILVY